MKSVSRLLFAFLLAGSEVALPQGINNLWTMGYDNGSVGWGGTDVNFNSGNPDTSYKLRALNFGLTCANICDQNGNLLFCTNGFSVSDASDSVMQNGYGLYISPYESNDTMMGRGVLQSSIIIPDPADSMKYYLFHEAIEIYVASASGASIYPIALYYSVIDMSLNGGLGAVTLKNIPLLMDTLASGQITACKHANGRDWWLIVPECGRPNYYMYLISPIGIQLISQQTIGIRDYTYGQCAFSPDGSKYAYYHWYSGLEVFDFDRCAGTFSNPVHVTNVDTVNQSGWGLAFSPDGKKIYVDSGMNLFQFDLNNPNLSSSQQTVATWDGFFDIYPFATGFAFLQLAPDGKIYISTGSSTHYLHCIEYPDSAGLSCNVQQHFLELPTWNYNTFPNHPNYFLGPLAGICDTVLAIEDDLSNDGGPAIYPNPFVNELTINSNSQHEFTELEVYNNFGALILKSNLRDDVNKMITASWAPGLYTLLLKNGKSFVTRKLLKSE